MFLPLSFAKVRSDETYLDTIKSICIQKTLQEKSCLLFWGWNATHQVCRFPLRAGWEEGDPLWSVLSWLPHNVQRIQENLQSAWAHSKKRNSWCLLWFSYHPLQAFSVPHHQGSLGAHGSPSSVCLGVPQCVSPTWLHPSHIGRLMWPAASAGWKGRAPHPLLVSELLVLSLHQFSHL